MMEITKDTITIAQRIYDEMGKNSRSTTNSGNIPDKSVLMKQVSELLLLCADDSTQNTLQTWLELPITDNLIIPCFLNASRGNTFDNAKIDYENRIFALGFDLAAADPEPAAVTSATTAPSGTGTGAAASGIGTTAGNGGNSANGTGGYVFYPGTFQATGYDKSWNYADMLCQLGYKFRRNLITDRIEVNGKEIDDYKLSEIYLNMRDHDYKRRTQIDDCINVIAAANEYNPIQDYLTSLKWDGNEILDQFVLLLNPNDPEYAGMIFRKWMISAVAKVMEQSQNSMLVIEGAQGSGKSSFVNWLCPLQDYFIEAAIQPDNKDDQIKACSKWIWEVKELTSTTRRADQDALKGFLTAKDHTYRPPFGRFPTTRPALACFVGTVNDDYSGFLRDVTGNRRFWTITSKSINWEYRTLYDVNDLWAEAFARWKRGDSYTLTPDENKALEKNQDQYKSVDSIAEAMIKYFDIDPGNQSMILPINDVREHLVTYANLGSLANNSTSLGNAAKSLGLERKTVKKNKTTQRCYVGIAIKTPIP